MEGLKLIEAGGVMLLFALIVLTLTLTQVGEVDTSVLMISAFPFLVILGVILIVVGWMMKKSEAVRDRLEKRPESTEFIPTRRKAVFGIIPGSTLITVSSVLLD